MTVGRKVKTANFTEPENRLLVQLLLENYNEYYGHLQSATRSEIGAIRDKLHQEWSEKINALGLSTRNPQQISEKVRKIVSKARSYISMERRNQMGLGVESTTPIIPLQSYMEPIIIKLRLEDDISGLDPLREYHAHSADLPLSRDEILVKQEFPAPPAGRIIDQEMLEDNVSYSNGDVPINRETLLEKGLEKGPSHRISKKRATLPYLRKRFLMKKIEIAEVRLRKEKKLLALAEIQLEKELRGYLGR